MQFILGMLMGWLIFYWWGFIQGRNQCFRVLAREVAAKHELQKYACLLQREILNLIFACNITDGWISSDWVKYRCWIMLRGKSSILVEGENFKRCEDDF